MNLLKIEYRHISEHGFALFCAKYRGTGWKSPTQKRHCECGKGSFRRKGAATRKKSGEGESNPCGNTPQSTKSGYSVPISAFGFPKRNICECINAFAPKFGKTLVLFYCKINGTVPA